MVKKFIKILLTVIFALIIAAIVVVACFVLDKGPLSDAVIFGPKIAEVEAQQQELDAANEIPDGVIQKVGDNFDVYFPKSDEGGNEVIVNIHGGGHICATKAFNAYMCAQLAKRGYMVYSVEYDRVPDVYVMDQLQQVSDRIDECVSDASKRAAKTKHIYLTGDSAGGWLALYAAACQRDERVSTMFGVTPAKSEIRALGLVSAEFYTTKLDAIGIVMSNHYFGNFYQNRAFNYWLDASKLASDVKLPPIFITTSGGDMLRDYTIEFADAMEKAGKKYELRDYASSDAPHDFTAYEPLSDTSQKALDAMCKYFKKVGKN